MSSSDPSTFDVAEFVLRLRESGEQRRLVEAERPTAQMAGEALARLAQAVRGTLDTSRDAARLEFAEEDHAGLWIPSRHSPATEDRTWVVQHVDLVVLKDEDGEPRNHLNHPLIDPVQCGVDLAHRFVRSAVDHLEALGLLMAHNVGLRAPMTLSRAVLEATASALFLLDGEVGPRERTRRIWNQQLSDLKETIWASSEPDERLVALAERDAILNAAEQSGFKVRRPKKITGSAAVLMDDGSEVATTQHAIEQALDAEVGSAVWRGLSRVAHSGESYFLTLEHVDHNAQIPAMRAESVAQGSMASLLVFARLGDVLERHLGWDQISWSGLFDPVLEVWGAVAGWSDDAIRLDLGFPSN